MVMKKKRYVMPHIMVEKFLPENPLAAGSFQSDEPGAKPGDMFDEEFEEGENVDYDSYHI